jgi:dihydrofolate reductase
MRKVFFFMMVSLDGYFEGPHHQIDWHNVADKSGNMDKEFDDFAISQLDEADTILFGRVTYQMMASFWPTDYAKKADPVVAEQMNKAKKIVFSKTLDKADWENTRLVNGDAAAEVARLKKGPGKGMVILGSSDLAVSLMKAGLVDELRIMTNPVVIGQGKQLFSGLDQKIRLKLLKVREFKSGNVLLYYQPVKEKAQ